MAFKKRIIDFDRVRDKLLILLYDFQINKNDEYTLFGNLNQFNFGINKQLLFTTLLNLTNGDFIKRKDASDFGYFTEDDFGGDVFILTIPGIEYVNELFQDYCNKLFDELKLNVETTANNFEPADWSPLPITKEELKEETVEAVQKAITAIEQDNGYAATHPEERNSVLESLKAGLNLIKENKLVKWTYNSLLIEPLKKVSSKFANNRIEEFISKAWEAIVNLFSS